MIAREVEKPTLHRFFCIECRGHCDVSYYAVAGYDVPKPKGWTALRPGSWVCSSKCRDAALADGVVESRGFP